MAVCGGDADVVTGPARFPQQDRLAGPNAEAALQMAGQRAGDRHRPVLDGVPLDEEDGHVNPGYSNMFFILLRMLPSWSSDSPLLRAYSSSSSFCFGVSFVGISTFTRMS